MGLRCSGGAGAHQSLTQSPEACCQGELLVYPLLHRLVAEWTPQAAACQ